MKLEIFDSIQKLESEDWNRLVDPDFPFFLYHFFFSLETTDCVGTRTGWFPYYLVVRDGERAVAQTVVYKKTNSWGEYVFDFAWAEAHHAYRLNYYPKLVTAVPFTPATGPKIHFAQGLTQAERETAGTLLLEGFASLGEELEASSHHVLFPRAEELPLFEKAGYFRRLGLQFHWTNAGYKTFDDFLAGLRSKRRYELKREREQVAARGVRIEERTGRELTPELADLFYAFYLTTIDKKASYDYLTRDFFRSVFAHLGNHILLYLAYSPSGEPVAGALNYFGTETLYGRNWGCLDEYRALHFELCYHQGIEAAIRLGLKRFEAGAQGEHKLNRGFLPEPTYSVHKVKSDLLLAPIQRFCLDEARAVRETLDELRTHSPYARVST